MNARDRWLYHMQQGLGDEAARARKAWRRGFLLQESKRRAMAAQGNGKDKNMSKDQNGNGPDSKDDQDSDEMSSQTFTGRSCVINHSGEFSGPITLAPVKDGTVGEAIEVDVGDILDFVAEAIKAAHIEDIEGASTEAILGLPFEDEEPPQ